jgi:DNA-binding winged helix-turn-helix (wHTH) protein/tetratricopeptide (TPR) repeat protein
MGTNENVHRSIAFGSFEMNVKERLLLHNGKPVAIAPKLFDALLALVENAGHIVEKDQLMDRLWGDTFVEESSLSQNIFQLRKILRKLDPQPEYIETIPKRGFRFASEVFDSASALVGRTPSVSAAEIRSIAVMPFAVLGEAYENGECLGLGMADAIIGRLAKLRGVTVMPTRTMLRYAGRLDDLQGVSRECGVHGVLEGAVQRNAERIRVTVQLLDVTSEACVWSAKFDTSAGDVFVLQDLISQQIADALALEWCMDESHTVPNDSHDIAAYQAYLMGFFFSNKRTHEGLSKSIGYFREALSLDPRYARAHAGLADSFFWLAYGEVSPDFRGESFERSREHALAALELDPFSAEAHAALATVMVKHDHNTAGAERSFRRAIEVDPACSMALSRFTYFLAAAGRLDEALEMSSRGQKLDPLSPDANANLAMILYFLRRYTDAIRYSRTALALEPAFSEAALLLGRCFEQKGMFEEAEVQYAIASKLEPHSHEGDELRAHLHAVTGRTNLAKREVSQLSASDRVKPYNIAAIYSALGDKKRASEWLDRPFVNWTERLRMLRYDPRLDSCRPVIKSL